jgi:hypothetical protein
MASVAQMTGTHVDSACKHIIPVRNSMDSLLGITDQNDPNTILRDKMKYSAHKLDLLLCCNRPMFKDCHGPFKAAAAYPRILSTLNGIDPMTKRFLCFVYSQPRTMDVRDIQIMFSVFQEEIKPKHHLDEELFNKQMAKLEATFKKIPDFTFMGYSLGLGYMHPSNGDTVVSSLIGGLLTVQNGDFDVFTGDYIMWYFDFEKRMFDTYGERREETALWQDVADQNGQNGQNDFLPRDAKRRRTMAEKQNGNYDTLSVSGKSCIFLVKPVNIYDMQKYANDKKRVFARALSNARAWDKLDIVIGAQASI